MKKRKFYQSVWLAINGIADCISKERNIKIQTVIGIAVIVVSLLLRISTVELAIIISICFLVIVLEMLNTGVEKLFDILRPDYNGDIRKVKDIMAGAVLLAAILSIILGFMILLNPIIDFFKTAFS